MKSVIKKLRKHLKLRSVPKKNRMKIFQPNNRKFNNPCPYNNYLKRQLKKLKFKASNRKYCRLSFNQSNKNFMHVNLKSKL